MGWELEDHGAPQAAVTPAAGGWALEDVPANPDAPWYERIMSGVANGFQHRNAVESERAARAVDNPLMAGVLAANPLAALFVHQPATGGPAEAAAAKNLQANDAANPAPPGVLGALAYGVGESPEAMAAPELRAFGPGVWKAAGNAIVNGAAQGAYASNATDRDATWGTALGAVGGLAGKLAGAFAGKVWNAARGVWEDSSLKALDTLGKANGVPLGISDLAPESGFTNLNTLARFIPGSGVQNTRKMQAEGLSNLVEQGQADIRQPGSALDTALGSNTHEQLIADDVRKTLTDREATARGMFQAIPKDVEVAPTEFLPALQKLQTEYPGILDSVGMPETARKRVAALLNPPKQELTKADQDAINALGGSQITAGSLKSLETALPGITERMSGAPKPTEPLTAGDAHWLQSALGDTQRALDTQTRMGQRVGGAGKFVGEAKSALQNDMNAVDNGAFATARKYFAEKVVPFREDPNLRNLAESGSTGEGMFNQLGNDRVGTADALMSVLGPEGQLALQHGYLSRLGNKAVNDNLSSGVSTAKLSKAFDFGDAMGQNRAAQSILTPDQLGQADVARQLGQAARGASDWAHQPATGAQNVWLNALKAGAAPIMAGGAVASGGLSVPLGMMAAAAPTLAGRAINKANMSPAFKNLYFAAAKNPSDPMLQALLAQAMAGQASPNPPPSLLDALGQ